MTRNIAWSKVNLEIARRIAEHGQIRLEAQMTVACAADQRAMSFTSAMMAAAATTFAAAAAAYSHKDLALLAIPAVLMGLCFTAASTLAALSCKPGDFGVAGNYPKNLYDAEAYLRGPVARAYGWDAEGFQYVVECNDRVLARNGRLMRLALYCGCAAPVIGLLTWLLALWGASVVAQGAPIDWSVALAW